MQKLFLVYLGGRAAKANIELHDVQFVVAGKIEEAYPALCTAWFGSAKGLHIDSYVALQFIDGYRVEPRKEPSLSSKQLYFVNFGGYHSDSIAELHQFSLFVAESPSEAKSAAQRSLLVSSEKRHKDDLFDIDDCISLTEVGGYFIHLLPDSGTQLLRPDWFGYNVIG